MIQVRELITKNTINDCNALISQKKLCEIESNVIN